jgi:hypothetical protein
MHGPQTIKFAVYDSFKPCSDISVLHGPQTVKFGVCDSFKLCSDVSVALGGLVRLLSRVLLDKVSVTHI